jgi:hypothetical protein
VRARDDAALSDLFAGVGRPPGRLRLAVGPLDG